MIKYFCDRCGAEVREIFAHKYYISLMQKEVIMCPPCRQAYEKAIAEAEKLFFDNAIGDGVHDRR